jgi:MYXO-CTERM domain-containing protein
MADESFIPPGQEELVGAMLGSDVALPGDCRLVSGNLEKTTIKATYACPSGDVVVELIHPAAAPTDAVRTEKFALRVERGTAPADFQSVLLSRIREREGQFRWTVYPARTPPAEPMAVTTLSGGVVLGLLVLAALLLRRRHRTVATRE